jgi:hypothetical protein
MKNLDVPSLRRKLFGHLRRGIFLFFAIVGFFSFFGGPILGFLLAPLYHREITQRVYSPDGSTVAEVEVTTGGFGTVWTTRVRLIPSQQQGWLIYKTKDSDFTPSLRWRDRDTLIIGLPCYRVGHLSNPDDWERSDPNERRFKVRFDYVEDCE